MVAEDPTSVSPAPSFTVRRRDPSCLTLVPLYTKGKTPVFPDPFRSVPPSSYFPDTHPLETSTFGPWTILVKYSVTPSRLSSFSYLEFQSGGTTVTVTKICGATWCDTCSHNLSLSKDVVCHIKKFWSIRRFSVYVPLLHNLVWWLLDTIKHWSGMFSTAVRITFMIRVKFLYNWRILISLTLVIPKWNLLTYFHHTIVVLIPIRFRPLYLSFRLPFGALVFYDHGYVNDRTFCVSLVSTLWGV